MSDDLLRDLEEAAKEDPELASRIAKKFGAAQHGAGQKPPQMSFSEYAYSRIVQLANTLEMIDHPQIKNILDTIYYDPEDEETVRELYDDAMGFLEPEYRIWEQYQSPFEPLPTKEDAAGDIRLGQIFDIRVGKTIGSHDKWPSKDFFLTFKELNQHTLIMGRSGSGKTSLITNMMIELIKKGVPCWAIDMQRDYRGLVNLFPNKVIVARWEQFKFNPLRPPPRVTTTRWIARFTDILCEALVGYRGAKNIIQRCIEKLFEEYDVENTNTYPSMHDLGDFMDRLNPKELSWRERQHLGTAHSIIEMATRNLRDMIDCDQGFPIDKLLEKNVIFELDGMGEEIKTLFVNLLLGWVLTYRIATGHREGYRKDEKFQGLQNIIVFDEAKMVFDKGREKDKRHGVPYLMEAVATVRKFGVGMLVADQMWSMLSRSITTNVATKICMSCQDKDLQDIARYIGLDSQEQVKQLRSLPAMNAIVKLSERHIYPFRIFFRLPQYERKVDDLQIELKSGYILEKMGWKPAKKREKDRLFEEEGTEQETTFPSFLPKEAGEMLLDICEHPFSVVTERYERLKLSPDKGDSAKDYLIKNELANEDAAEYGRGGGRVVILSLSKKGMDIIGKTPEVPGKGGMVHRYNQNRAFEIFSSRGYICQVEAPHSTQGESIDVMAGKGSHAFGVEIELGNELEQPVKNIRKCLEHGCTKVLVFCNTTLRNKLKKELRQLELPERDLNKIALMQISYLAPGADRKQQDEWIAGLEQDRPVDFEEEVFIGEEEEEETEGFNVHLGFDSSFKVEDHIKKSSISWDPNTATNPHVLIVGMSGSGKTETLKSFVYELYRKKLPSIVFDFHGEYVQGKFRKEVKANVIDHLKGVNINPLELPVDPATGRVKPSEVAYEIAEIIDSIYRLGGQQKSTFRNAIFHAYEWAGILKDEPETWDIDPPEFSEVNKAFEHLHLLEAKKSTVASSLKTKLSEIFDEGLFSAKEMFPVDSLFDGVTILNLKSLHRYKNLQLVLSRFFLKKIYNEMMKRQISKEVRMFCVIDEAHKVVSDKVIIDIVREARKFGLGLILGSQSPKDFHADVFSNTATKIILKGSIGKDTKAIIDNLGIYDKKDRDKIKAEILRLKPGRAFIVSDHYLPYKKVTLTPYGKRVEL